MRVKTIRREKGAYIRLPEDLRKLDEVELFQLREGYYLLSAPLGEKPAEKPVAGAAGGLAAAGAKQTLAGGLTPFETRVLGKLAGIKFGRRVPFCISREFSRQEREALLSLEKKGAVTFIKSKKYPSGVYNIQNEFYPHPQKKEAEQETGVGELEKQLFRDGYVVVQDARTAQSLSDMLQKQKGAVTGVKGFDGKYYVVTRAHMERVRRVLARWRGEHVDPKALAAKFGIHPDGVKAVLKILSEGGEYMEKGDVFLKVD